MAKNLKVWIQWGQKGLTGLTGGLKGLKTNLRESALQAQALNVQLKRVDSGLAKIQKGIAMIGVAGAAGFGLILKEGLQVVAVFEEIHLALEVMLKSKSAADEMMRDVTKFAATTPFELKEVAEGAKLLLAFRTEASEVIPVLRTLGEAASVMGVPIAQAVRALNQLRLGMFETQQLVPIGLNRKLFQERGIEFSSSGQLKSSGEEAYQAALQILTDTYGGLFKRANELLRTKWANFKDNITIFLNETFQGAAETVKGWIDRINKTLGELLGDKNALKAIGDAIAELMEPLNQLMGVGAGQLERLVELLKTNPQGLVNAMQSMVNVGKDLLALFLAITGTRVIIALVMGLAALAAALGGGTILTLGVAGGVTAGVIFLFKEFRKLLSGMDGDVNSAAGAFWGLGESLFGVGTATDQAITAQSLLRDQFKENITVARTWIDVLQDVVFQLLDIDGLTRENARTQAEREASSQLGESRLVSGGSVTLQRGGPQGPDVTFPTGRLGNLWQDWRLESLSKGGHFFQGQPVTSFTGTPEQGVSLSEAAGLAAVQRARQDAAIAEQPSGMGDLRLQEGVRAAGQKTKDILNSIPDAGTFGCVIKQGNFLTLLGGEDAEQLVKAFESGSTQTTAAALQKGFPELRTSREALRIGDTLILDRMEGRNTPSGGHTGTFLGYDDQGRMLISGNKKGSSFPIDKSFEFFGPDTPYTNQRGVFGFKTPFSPIRNLLGQTNQFAQDTTPSGGIPGFGEIIEKNIAAAVKFQEDLEKAASALATTLEERIQREMRMAELTGETEAAMERVNQLLVDAGLSPLFPLFDPALQNRITSAMEAFSDAHAERAAQLREDIERERTRAAEQAEAGIEATLLAIAGKDQKAAAVRGAQALTELEQAQSDLVIAEKQGRTDLDQFNTAVSGATQALLSLILALPESATKTGLMDAFNLNQSNLTPQGRTQNALQRLREGTWLNIGCNGDGTCNFQNSVTGETKTMPSNWQGGGGFDPGSVPDTFPDTAKDKTQDTAGRLRWAGAGLVNALTTIINGIQQGGAALVQSLFSAAAQLIPSAAPILGPLGGLFGALTSLFSGKKRLQVDANITGQDQLLQVQFARQHALMPSANRASAAFGERLLQMGAAPPQVVKHILVFQGDAKRVLSEFVAEAQSERNFQEFGSGANFAN